MINSLPKNELMHRYILLPDDEARKIGDENSENCTHFVFTWQVAENCAQMYSIDERIFAPILDLRHKTNAQRIIKYCN